MRDRIQVPNAVDKPTRRASAEICISLWRARASKLRRKAPFKPVNNCHWFYQNSCDLNIRRRRFRQCRSGFESSMKTHNVATTTRGLQEKRRCSEEERAAR
ncbi:unnamed protein product [Caenorhabditis brenneri]